MNLKNDIRRDDEARREGEREAPRAGRGRAARFLVPAAVALAGISLSVAAARRAEANAPPCRYDSNSSTVVFDKDTGLTWQRNNLASYHFEDAKTYCAGQSFGGLPGWRMPTLQELLTLVDDKETQPAIDSSAFPNTPGLGFWTSTPNAENSTQVWIVSFYGGLTSATGTTGMFLVRCVR